MIFRLQQYLPFTVLKLEPKHLKHSFKMSCVATVLTVYGIETFLNYHSHNCVPQMLQQYLPFTVLKLYWLRLACYLDKYPLQQYLPFTVLKLKFSKPETISSKVLQQYLPFTVLKLHQYERTQRSFLVATVLTVYGIETLKKPAPIWIWVIKKLQQYLPFTVLKR